MCAAFSLRRATFLRKCSINQKLDAIEKNGQRIRNQHWKNHQHSVRGFYGPNGHLHPNGQKSALLEHLGHNVNPSCEFNIDNVKILDICNNDLKLRYMESIYYLKLDHQSLNSKYTGVVQSLTNRRIPLKLINNMLLSDCVPV